MSGVARRTRRLLLGGSSPVNHSASISSNRGTIAVPTTTLQKPTQLGERSGRVSELTAAATTAVATMAPPPARALVAVGAGAGRPSCYAALGAQRVGSAFLSFVEFYTYIMLAQSVEGNDLMKDEAKLLART